MKIPIATKKPFSKKLKEKDIIYADDFGISYKEFNKASAKTTCEGRILTLLKEKAYNITEISLLLNIKYATIQANLSRMKKKGLLIKKKEGRKAYYGLKVI